MKSTMELSGMTFRARHGVHWSEKLFKKRFKVDLRAIYDISPASASDRIGDAVDFAKVYDTVKRGMDMPADLLETVASNVFGAVKEGFPALGGLEVKVSKFNPPVRGRMKFSSITVSE